MRATSAVQRRRAPVRHRAATTRVLVRQSLRRGVPERAPEPPEPGFARTPPERAGLGAHAWGMVAVVTLAVLVALAFKLQAIELGYRLSQLRVQHEELLRDRRELEVKQAYLADPGRIEKRARAELDMHPRQARDLRVAE